MIRKLCVVLIVLACIAATPAFAYRSNYQDEYRPYLTIGGGFTLAPDTDVNNPGLGGEQTLTSKDGYNILVATGLAYNVGRIEFSIQHHRNNFEDRIIKATNVKVPIDWFLVANTFLVSVYYDFNKDGAVSPYFGGGLGVSQLRLESLYLQSGGEDNAFSYQVSAGVSFNISENTQLDLGYKLLGMNEADLGATNQEKMILNSATAALRFLF